MALRQTPTERIQLPERNGFILSTISLFRWNINTVELNKKTLDILSIVLFLNFTNLIIDTLVDTDVLKMVTVLGRTWSPKDVPLLIPRTCKRYFADVIKLRILKQEIILDYPR